MADVRSINSILGNENAKAGVSAREICVKVFGLIQMLHLRNEYLQSLF